MDTEAIPGLPEGLLLDGKFKIENRLGLGGMGEVYRARQTAVDRIVAVKVLHAALTTNRVMVARFREEMRSTTQVEHPNIVRVYDVGESLGRLYLAMEFLDGPSLRKVIQTAAPMPVDRVANIAIQIANALGAAHANGIVHRDLKPDNIILLDVVGNREFVKVVDFGIARSLDASREQLTLDGTLLGTPGYLAPEQALGKPVDERTDLYALGTILYEMLSGRLPFQGDNTMALMMARATKTPLRISEIVPQLPVPVAGLVMDLLAIEPAARPASAKAVVAALQGWTRQSPGIPPHLGGQDPPFPSTAVLPVPPPPITQPSRTTSAEAPPLQPIVSPSIVTRSGNSGPRTLSTKNWVKPLLILTLIGFAVVAAAIYGIVAIMK